MTISTETRKYRYEGDGVVDTFAFDNRIFATSDLTVQLLTRATDAVVSTLTETTDYTVTILSNGNASVEITNVSKIPSASQDILLKAETPITQASSLPTGTPFPAKTVENALDKVTVLVQEMQEQFDRTVRVPPNSSTTADLELPTPQANKFFRWNADADGLENIDISTLGGVAVGTSGAVVGLLNANKTDSGNNTFSGTNTFLGDNISTGTATFSHATGVTTNTINERTAGVGVTIDSVLLKDGAVVATGGVNPNSSGGTALTAIDNNTYTPTLTNTTNIAASTAFILNYSRQNDYVNVCGRVDIDPTAAGAIELRMSIPISSNLTQATHAGGSANCTAVAGQQMAVIGTTTNTVSIVGIVTDTANRQYSVNFSYRIR